jgi:selenocysteine-specific elongation factor
MFVIGTAGHVDHGKSTLVHALTGIDPDRLREEKARGMTIELGFAWLKLPGGSEVSVVDVPGHERFIKSMLMGAGGIDVALLIVAADEGVMPQTREHLAVLDLLAVRRGIVVMTKRDLVDDDWAALVAADIGRALKGTSLEGSQIIAVSAIRGAGLDELKLAIEQVLDGLPPKPDLGRPRLPVDRSFAMPGFGAVVTGTLIDGRLRPGDEVEVQPKGLKARVRGVQTHRKPIEAAMPGTRVAVNLSGVDHHQVTRGDVITSPGWLRPTAVFDAIVRVIPGSPRAVRHNHRVSVHLMTMEAEASVRLLDAERLRPGESGLAQVRLEAPLAVVKGDRFIIRDTEETLGGGVVLEPVAIRHRRFDEATLRRLRMLEGGSPEETVLGALQKSEPADATAVARAANLPAASASKMLDAMVASGKAVRIGEGTSALHYSPGGWAGVEARAKETVTGYHRAFPLRSGMPKEELRSRLRMNAAAFAGVLQALQERRVVTADDYGVRLPSHQPRFSPSQQQIADEYLRRLSTSPFSPPTDSPVDPEILQALADQGRVVKATEDVVFLKPAFDEMVRRAVEHARQHGQITIQDVRDMFGTSRKYTLAFLEHLDRQQMTRRQGDARVLR